MLGLWVITLAPFTDVPLFSSCPRSVLAPESLGVYRQVSILVMNFPRVYFVCMLPQFG